MHLALSRDRAVATSRRIRWFQARWTGEQKLDSQVRFIIIMDWADGKLGQPDHFKQNSQSFVVRLRDNVHLEKPKELLVKSPTESSVIRDSLSTRCPTIPFGKHQSWLIKTKSKELTHVSPKNQESYKTGMQR